MYSTERNVFLEIYFKELVSAALGATMSEILRIRGRAS